MTKIDSHDLIPGHVYREKNGAEIIFVGYGTYRCYAKETSNYNWGSPIQKFLYMKKADVIAKISDGRLSKDLLHYDGHATGKKGAVPDFFTTVLFSDRPRVLTEDLGEMFPSEMFRNWTVTDITIGEKIYWEVKTNPVPEY